MSEHKYIIAKYCYEKGKVYSWDIRTCSKEVAKRKMKKWEDRSGEGEEWCKETWGGKVLYRDCEDATFINVLMVRKLQRDHEDPTL